MRWSGDLSFDDDDIDEEEFEEEEPVFAGRRVSNLGANLEEWNERTGNGASTYNLCESHARDLDRDPHCFDDYLSPYNGDPVGEDGWGGDVEHPNFDDDENRCYLPFCRRKLTGW